MDFSVIIPTYNRCESLRRCLTSLGSQDYAGPFEVLVVDDGSTDGTRLMLEEYAGNCSFLRWFSQPHKGPAAARNLGLKESAAGLVGFTDDDCLLEKDWIRKMVQAHRDAGIFAVGGLTKVAPGNIRARVSQFLSDGAIRAKVHGKKEVIFFPTCNVSLKKQLLGTHAFNEAFPLPGGEDLDFFWRFYKSGFRLAYQEEIVAFHDCHPDLASFLRQAYRYGRGNFFVRLLHHDQPLLKELKTGGLFFFLAGLALNALKIPRFTVLCSRGLIGNGREFSIKEQFKIYGYFAAHKAMYLFGNVVEYMRYRRKGRGPGIEKPAYVIFDVTHRCNLKCPICEIHKNHVADELTTREIEDLIVQSKRWGIENFVFSGGEAFLRPDILSLLEAAKRMDYRVGVLTNGTTIDESFLEKISSYLMSGYLSLSVSLDSLNPKIHDGIRGHEGCFVKTLACLKALAALKRAEPRVNFNTISIMLNDNLEELLPLAGYLKTLGVNSIQFQPLLANNLVMESRSDRGPHWIPAERLGVLDRVIDALIVFKKENSALVRNSENNLQLAKKYFRHCLTPTDVRCLYGARTMLIAPNGDVTTCFDCYGNIRKAPLERIHHSPMAQKARDRAGRCPVPCLLPCFTDN